MSPTMKAIILSSISDPPAISVEEKPIPTAGPGSVVVQIIATLIPDYQRQVFTGARGYPLKVPLTPGGNGIARVSAIGPDTTALKVGQLVLVDIFIRARDDPANNFLFGFHAGGTPEAQKLAEGPWRHGTLAQYASVPLENVLPLNEERLCGELGYTINDLTTIQPCSIPSGGLCDAGVKSGDVVIVVPATGTFGGAAVLTALAMGASVIACGRNQESLDYLAKFVGSPKDLKTVKLNGDVEKDTAALLAASGAGGADVCIDFSPPGAAEGGKTPTHLLAALGALRNSGTLALMGGIQGNISIPYGLVMYKSIAIKGRFMYERDHIQRVVRLAEQGKLKLGAAVGKQFLGPYGLDQINEAMDVAEKNPGYSKAVVLTP